MFVSTQEWAPKKQRDSDSVKSLCKNNVDSRPRLSNASGMLQILNLFSLARLALIRAVRYEPVGIKSVLGTFGAILCVRNFTQTQIRLGIL